MRSKDTLFLYTFDYPCDKTALEQYVNTELNVIHSAYKKIYIFPINYKDVGFDIPKNVTVVDISLYSKTNLISKILFLIQSILQTITEGIKSKNKNFFKRVLIKVMFFYSSVQLANNLNNFIKANGIDNTKVLHFSYWFSSWVLSLSILKRKGKIKNFYSRAHQADVYFDNEMFHSYFHHYKVKHITKVFAISNHATDFLQTKFGKFKNKFETAYLGVTNNFLNPVSEIDKPVHIVSCSKIIYHKRNHLTCEVLQAIDFPVKWTHYGLLDGGYDLYNQAFEKLKENKFVEIDFRGLQPNERILNDYKSTSIDLFFSTSEREGLSFAMIEALSFGIPILATDINGTKEICNEITGHLMPLNFELSDALNFIKTIRQNKPNSKLRDACRNYFIENFMAETNFLKFHEKLIIAEDDN
jgi:glycosyltransferase involved in cell wall biosynthesis